MNREIKAYLGLEAKVSSAFNFFINGMLAALIYHKADVVPADTVSLAIDIATTCLFLFTLIALFSTASLKRSKTAGILESTRPTVRRLSRLFRRPLLFGLLAGLAAALVLFVLAAPIFALLGLKTIPFGVYIALKSVSCALLGGSVTPALLYIGMCGKK